MASQHESQSPESRNWATDEDGRIKSMLEAAPVPEHLNDRIKARLRSASLIDPCLEALSPAESGSDSYVERETHVPEQVHTGTKRRLALIALAATFLAGFAFLSYQWRQPNERDWLVKQSETVLSTWEQDNPANLELNGSLSDVPSSVREQLARATLRGTRSLAALGSKLKGTLYRFDAADGNSLVLLRMADLPAVRGLNSRFATLSTRSGGWCLAALRLNNETYVLAAHCTEQQLMNYIRRPVVT